MVMRDFGKKTINFFITKTNSKFIDFKNQKFCNFILKQLSNSLPYLNYQFIFIFFICF